MSVDFDKLLNLDGFGILNQYAIEFGIFQEDGNALIDVNILELDDTTTLQKINVADIMYFTEMGTITIPGKHLLEKSIGYINHALEETLDSITDDIFLNDNRNIVEKLNSLCNRIESYVKSLFVNEIKKTNKLGVLLNQKDENKYFYDLKDLSKYIKCKLLIK